MKVRELFKPDETLTISPLRELAAAVGLTVLVACGVQVTENVVSYDSNEPPVDVVADNLLSHLSGPISNKLNSYIHPNP